MVFRHSTTNEDDPHAGKIEIAARIVYETAKAYRLNDGTQEFWVPKTKVGIERNRDGTVAAFLPEWLAKEKGLI